MKALVSCIVPVFNGARYVTEALDSVFQQTHQPVEVIVVDDASTDDTARVVASYGAPVAYLWQPNSGPAAARNAGLRAAHASFIAFLDADDLWHPEKLQRQMARFAARPELDVCVTHIQNFWIPELRGEAERFLHQRIAGALPGYSMSTVLLRRRALERIGDFDPTIRNASATDWFTRAVERGAVMELLSDVLVYRRLHHDNTSRRASGRSHDEHLRIVKAHLDRLRLRGGA